MNSGPSPAAIHNDSADWGKRNTAGVAIASSLLFDAISHDFGNGPVLSDVSIAIEPGEILCLLGPSGSGKSTLLRIAAGIETPRSGSVWIDKRVVAGNGINIPPEKRNIGLVFQDFALFPHLDVEANVRFGLNGWSRKVAAEETARILSRVGMARFAQMYPHQLSGGEQQRVALARALAPRPAILLMDEPFSGLDSRLRDTVREQTIGLLRDTRSTAIIVTHDPEEALRIGDRIALMRGGRLVQLGTGRELYEEPNCLFSARFFSELNLMQVAVSEGFIETPLGRLEAGKFSHGDPVSVCVRLSDVLVEPQASAAAVPGRIISRHFMGVVELLEISVEGNDDPVRSRIRAGSLPPDTRDVWLQIKPDTAMIFPAT